MRDDSEAFKRLTEVNVASSRLDWLEIKSRVMPPPGVRQRPFSPTEVVLCLAAMLLVSHNRFGGSTSHLAPTPIPELARLFRRPPSSILAKMANLDGSRTNGGKAEMAAAAALLVGDAAALLDSYRAIMRAARSEGIGPAELPDFLVAEDGALVLLGQEELTDHEIEVALQDRVEAVSMGSGLAEHVTERLLVAVARVGQHVFAGDVLKNCGHACVFCGLSPGPTLQGRGLLRASHIKPWRHSDPKERLAVTNGLSACPDHDVAFDSGLLYLNDAMVVQLGDELRYRIEREPRMKATFGQPPVARQLLLPTGAKTPDPIFVQWHRERIAAA